MRKLVIIGLVCLIGCGSDQAPSQPSSTQVLRTADLSDGADAGEPGPPGRDGAPGVPGAIGPEGPEGQMGPQGERGERGAQGIQGERGEQGLAGPQGLQGIQGPAGQDGAPGGFGAAFADDRPMIPLDMIFAGVFVNGAWWKFRTVSGALAVPYVSVQWLDDTCSTTPVRFGAQYFGWAVGTNDPAGTYYVQTAPLGDGTCYAVDSNLGCIELECENMMALQEVDPPDLTGDAPYMIEPN